MAALARPGRVEGQVCSLHPPAALIPRDLEKSPTMIPLSPSDVGLHITRTLGVASLQ
jgi:hypothetical protein